MDLRKRLSSKRMKLSPLTPLFKPQNREVSTDGLWRMLEQIASQIIKERFAGIQSQIDAKQAQLNAEIESAKETFLSQLPAIKRNASDIIEEHIRTRSIELKGPKGDKGDKGDSVKGDRGEPGYTPIKGKDYVDGAPGEPGLPGENGSPDTPDEVVAKINKADSLIALKKIDGLIPALENLSRRERGSGGGGSIGNIQHESTAVSSATTTVTTTYRIAGRGFALWVYYNGQLLSRGVQYTVGTDLKTLTFTFTLDDSSTVDVIYMRS